jgi:hypothetical protein
MTLLWNRRRPSLGKRLMGTILVVIAAAGISMAAEVLRRRLGQGPMELGGIPPVRRARTRARRRRRAGRRPSRVLSAP